MGNEQLFRLIMPDGMHLANPQDDPNVFLGAFFDEENHLKGQARWEPVSGNDDDSNDIGIDPDDGDSPAAAMAAAVIAIAAVAGTAVYLANNEQFRNWWDKTVVHWWNDSVKPSVGKLWNKVTRQKNDSEASQPIALLTSASEETNTFSKEVDEAIEECQLHMNSEEAQNRLLVIMYKAMDLAKDIRELSSANIRDSDFDEKTKLELRQTMEKLTTQNVTDLINKALERNIPLLEQQKDFDAWSALLGKMTKDGEFVPLRSDALRTALSLEPYRAMLEAPSHNDEK
ncbi:hypothetical protein [Bifidobacterium oedipodis]|uniref:Uncharacterized protein n=1 Tax=Bifidobacterium oedipodis TaxID=2675322 RepID=A0A7Y0ENC0_9BIFI|nr:hypothetical protein [Bifidobacterium sp. DSM 109957]NMM93458.1 hypothetical protein [Bifidobacterium sp. DSM 109957]